MLPNTRVRQSRPFDRRYPSAPPARSCRSPGHFRTWFPESIVVLTDEAQRFHERPELSRVRELPPADAERVIDFRSAQNQEHCGKDGLPCRSGTAMERRFYAPAIRFFQGEAARHNAIDERNPEVRICQIFRG